MQRIWPDHSLLDDTELFAAYTIDRTAGRRLRMNFVCSLDGAVEVGGYSRGLSNEDDQKVLHALRVHADAVMVGAGTLRHEGYGPMRLTAADHAVRAGLAPDPTLVVVSASLRLDPSSDALALAPVRPVVLTIAASPGDRRADLEKVADVVICGDTAVDPVYAMRALHERGLDQVLCEGGPRLFGTLLAADLVDEMCLTISAKLAGSGAGRIVADGRRNTPADMRLVHVIVAGDTLLTRYSRT
jgi:riboflavin biosynthesis pyrimidine reductase